MLTERVMHKTVLLKKTIEGLEIRPGEIFFDATLGGGGHSQLVCELFGKDVKIYGIDADSDAVKMSEEKLSKCGCKYNFKVSNFSLIKEVIKGFGLEKVNKIIFDLGWSSNQLENSGRGFSFQKDEPLLMTIKKEVGPKDITAFDVVNTWSEKSLADVIYGYGGERFSRRIAKEIVDSRYRKPINTTFELVRIIEKAVPSKYKNGKIHFATKTFQAIRIATNNELENLKVALKDGIDVLADGGRIAVISFHSLEDRIVKNIFKQMQLENMAKIITKKPIIPDDEELLNNPRSRSAKLRILQKCI